MATNPSLEFTLKLAADQFQAEIKRAQASFDEAMKGFEESTKKPAEGLSAAFSKLGIRDAKTIQADIDAINAAMKTLADSGNLSSSELQRAFAAAEKKVKALANEMGAAQAKAQTFALSVNAGFASIGIRSSGQITADIAKIETALRQLANDAAVTGKDFDRAFAAGQVKLAELRAEMSGASGAAANFGKSAQAIPAQLGGISSAVSSLAGPLLALFSVGKIAEYTVAIDGLRRSFQAITGSAEAAAREFDYISRTSNRLGLDIESAGKAYAGLIAATKGSSAEGAQTRAIFESVSNAMSKLGKSSADTEGALLALQQMFSKGTVQAEEFRGQLAERLPGALKATADEMKLSKEQFTKLLETGQLLATDVAPALAKGLEKIYGGGSQAEVQGFNAEWNRLKNTLALVGGSLSESEGVLTAVKFAFDGIRTVILALVTAIAASAAGFSNLTKQFAELFRTLSTFNFKGFIDRFSEIGSTIPPSLARLSEETKKAGLSFIGLDESAKKTAASTGEVAANADEASGSIYALRAAILAESEAQEKSTQNRQLALEALQQQNKADAERLAIAGNQIEITNQAAEAAQKEADLSREVALSKETEAIQARRLLEIQQESLAKKTQATDSERKALDDQIAKQKQVAEAKELEAQKTRAQAEALEIVAEKRRIDATAAQNNAARVQEFRQALDAANDGVIKATETGIGLEEATRKQRDATALYRDALSDATKALEEKEAAEQRQLAVLQKRQSLDVEKIKTERAQAEARGDALAVSQADVALADLGAKNAKEKAAQLQEQYDVQRKLADAQIAEINASSKNADQKQAEIAAIRDNLALKQLDTEASNEQTKQAEANAEKVVQAERTKQDAIRGTTTAVDEGVGALDRFAASSQEAASKTDRAVRQMTLGFKLTEEATKALAASWGLGLPLTPIQAADAEVKKVQQDLAQFRDVLQTLPGEWQTAFNGMQSALMIGLEVAEQKKSLQTAIENVQSLDEAWFEAGNTISDTANASDFANRNLKLLDAADLSRLQGAVDAARQRFEQFRGQIDQAKGALEGIGDTLLENLLRQSGQLAAVENLNYQKQLKQAAELRAKGGAEAEADYQRTLALLEISHKKALENIAIQEKTKADADAKAQQQALDNLAKQGKAQAEIDAAKKQAAEDAAKKNKETLDLLNQINQAQSRGGEKQFTTTAPVTTGAGAQQGGPVTINFNVNASELLTEASIRDNIIPVINKTLRRGG